MFLLNNRFIQYSLVGSAAALVDWTLFYILAIYLEVFYLVSGTLSFIIAVLVNYFIGIKFLFISEIRFAKSKEILLVFFVSFIGLVMNLLLLYFFSSSLALDLMISKIIASFGAVLWNFLARNIFIYKIVKTRTILYSFNTSLMTLILSIMQIRKKLPNRPEERDK